MFNMAAPIQAATYRVPETAVFKVNGNVNFCKSLSAEISTEGNFSDSNTQTYIFEH